MKIDVANNGYVKLVPNGVSGTDLDPVNAARVSYNKESEELNKYDIGLLNFLGREDHTSPFRHSFMRFEVYAPLMVARQWFKYLVGSDHSEQPTRENDPFFGWNESSRRYVTEEIEFYIPQMDEWRSMPENSKQGSGPALPKDIGAILTEKLIQSQLDGLKQYDEALAMGVATEQARLFLPAYGLMVRWRWAASLQGVCHFLYQRLQHDSQHEIQEYAQAIDTMTREHFPNAVKAYVDNKHKQNKVLALLREHGITDIDALENYITLAELFGDMGTDE